MWFSEYSYFKERGFPRPRNFKFNLGSLTNKYTVDMEAALLSHRRKVPSRWRGFRIKIHIYTKKKQHHRRKVSGDKFRTYMYFYSKYYALKACLYSVIAAKRSSSDSSVNVFVDPTDSINFGLFVAIYSRRPIRNGFTSFTSSESKWPLIPV